jgi:hypothetical protein
LAAFVEDTHNIEARHVQAAMRDSELEPVRSRFDRKLLAGSVVVALVALGLTAWWMPDEPQTPTQQAALTAAQQARENPLAHPSAPPNPVSQTQTVTPQTVTPQPSAAQPGNALVPAPGAADQAAATPDVPAKGSPKTDNPPPPGPTPAAAPPHDSAAATAAKGTAATTGAPVGARDQPAGASSKLPAQVTARRPAEERASDHTHAAGSSGPPSNKAAITPAKSGEAAGSEAVNIPLSGTESSNQPANMPSLFVQRLKAGKQLLEQKNTVASIQLFYNEQINVGRIENFLVGAEGLGKLTEIFLLPAKFGSKDGLRVLYGTYPTVDAARNAIDGLPKKYKDAFATSIYIF